MLPMELHKLTERKTVMTKTLRYLVPALATVGAAGANAAAVDVAAVVTDIGAQAAPVGLIGVAVLLIYGAVKAFKWVRAALS